MQTLINEIEALGLVQTREKNRTCVHSFVDTNGDVYKTYSSGYVRRIFASTGEWANGSSYMYQLNRKTRGGHSRILIYDEASRLHFLFQFLKRKKLR